MKQFDELVAYKKVYYAWVASFMSVPDISRLKYDKLFWGEDIGKMRSVAHVNGMDIDIDTWSTNKKLIIKITLF